MMKTARIILLVLVVGASVTNYFATKSQRDALERPSSSVPATRNFFDMYAQKHDPWATAAVTRTSIADYDQQQAVIADQAWMREAVIVTCGTVIWLALAFRSSRIEGAA